MTQLPEGWKQDNELSIRTKCANGAWGSVTMYDSSSLIAGKFCWQAHRNNASLSGVVETQSAGILAAEEALALSESAFIRRAAQKIVDRISELQAELVAICCGDSVDVYSFGYLKGRVEALDGLRQLLNSAARLTEAV